ncbi:MAG: hypothetical protein ACRDLM_09035 [Gaiellaceae bacterium]
MNWLKRLLGGSGSSTTTDPGQPETAPEPPTMPSEPVEPATEEGAPESSDEEPA